MNQKTQWLDRYAFKNYVSASDNPRKYGWSRMPPRAAVDKKFIFTNPANLTSMLVIDVDKENAESFVMSKAWDDETVPEPNWVLTNQASSHAHVGYWLSSPVATSDESSWKARQYLYDIQKKLTVAFEGDREYTHLATRSPFALGHATKFIKDEPYTLRSIGEFLKDIEIPKIVKLNTIQGRNVRLFESVRLEAYKLRPKHSEYHNYYKVIYNLTSNLNASMHENPLPSIEVRSIASSIARWTWKHFSAEKLSKIQTSRVNKRWDKVRKGDLTNENRLLSLSEIREEIMFLHSRGLSHREIGNLVGLDKNIVKSRIQYAKKLNKL